MFSMNATKVFNTIEGGLLTYNDDSLTKQLELIKYYGMESPEDITYIGSNLKMNEFQAAMGLCNLPLLDKEIIDRKHHVDYYIQHLQSINSIKLPIYNPNIQYNYSYFPILIKHPLITRDQVYNRLKDKGINTKKYFYPLVTEYACYKDQFKNNLPISKTISEKVLCLPLYGELSESEIMFIINELKNALV